MQNFHLSDYLLQHLNLVGKLPVNRQLYRCIRQAILDQILVVNTRLTSSRTLALELGISRNTVLYAYEQLLAEGYLESRAGSGTYVTDTSSDTLLSSSKPLRYKVQTSTLSNRGQNLIANAGAASHQWGAFVPGVPDLTQFPHQIWNKLQSKVWRKPSVNVLTYSHGAGLEALRTAIADYLKGARSVACNPDQIVITNGTHQSIDLCLRLLSDPGDIAWVEDPCYWGARNLLKASGLTIRPIEVDAEGMSPSEEDMKHVPKFIFVTPSHQYPLGMVMSLSRRRLLLDYAARHSCWIMEDDYDSEFRYNSRPLACLQGMDSAERVLYMGTFSKTMFPGLRLGYLVLPTGLNASFITGMEEVHRSGQAALQATMAEFMNLSYYHSHIRRMRVLYGSRLEVLQNEIERHFAGTEVKVMGGDAGLHLTLCFPKHCDDVLIMKTALQQGIVTRALSSYHNCPSKARSGLVLGYASVDEQKIEFAFAQLAHIIQQHL